MLPSKRLHSDGVRLIKPGSSEQSWVCEQGLWLERHGFMMGCRCWHAVRICSIVMCLGPRLQHNPLGHRISFDSLRQASSKPRRGTARKSCHRLPDPWHPQLSYSLAHRAAQARSTLDRPWKTFDHGWPEQNRKTPALPLNPKPKDFWKLCNIQSHMEPSSVFLICQGWDTENFQALKVGGSRNRLRQFWSWRPCHASVLKVRSCSLHCSLSLCLCCFRYAIAQPKPRRGADSKETDSRTFPIAITLMMLYLCMTLMVLDLDTGVHR